MYGEEYSQYPYLNANDNTIMYNVESENERKSKDGETPAAQYSGGDEETENEDPNDRNSPFYHQITSYSNFKSRLPKGDFSFGDSDLDFELDALSLSGNLMEFSFAPFFVFFSFVSVFFFFFFRFQKLFSQRALHSTAPAGVHVTQRSLQFETRNSG